MNLQQKRPSPSMFRFSPSSLPSSSTSSSWKNNVFWFGVGAGCTLMYVQLATLTMSGRSYWKESLQMNNVFLCSDLHETYVSTQSSEDNYEDVNNGKDRAILNNGAELTTFQVRERRQSRRSERPSLLLPSSRYVWTDERKSLYKYNPPVNEALQRAKLNEDYCGTRESGYKKFFTYNAKNRSSSDEDKRIYKLFFQDDNINNDEERYYVELGAFDGKAESNTRFFDECLTWNGILIEANPKIYSRLLSNRPHSHRVSFAASCSFEEELQFNKTVGFWESWWTNSAQNNTPNRDAYAYDQKSVYVEVPCGSLTPVLLDIIPKGRIHFFSLDVEGVEPDVLENIDFDHVFIDVLIVENVNTYCKEICESRDRARTYMIQQGYLLYSDIVTRSDLYVHPSSSYAIKLKGYEPDRFSPTTTIRKNRYSTDIADGKHHRLWEKYDHHVPIPRTLTEIKSRANLIKCGTFPTYESFFQKRLDERSRVNEDKVIYNLFFKEMELKDMMDRNYHYVELGAFDGVQESNTRFFDECLGWTGLLIEPNPTVYPKLIANRPHAHRMSYAASCNATEEAANVTVGFYAAKYTNAVQDISANREVYVGKEDVPLVQVPCGSLTPVLLDIFQVNRRVHFFSLDTEGVEPMIVQNIDFNSVFVDILIAENTNSFCHTDDCPSRRRTREIMVQQNGYVLYTNVVKLSDLYVHPKSEFASKVQHLAQYNLPPQIIQSTPRTSTTKIRT